MSDDTIIVSTSEFNTSWDPQDPVNIEGYEIRYGKNWNNRKIGDRTFISMNPDNTQWVDYASSHPNEKYVLWDTTDCNMIWPYDIAYAQENAEIWQLLEAYCYLYVIFKYLPIETIKNLTVISTDINFEINVEKVQLAMYSRGEIDDDMCDLTINHILYPWEFLNTIQHARFQLRPEYYNSDKKYNVIMPNFARKLGRLHMISELCDHEHFKYSNIGHAHSEGRMKLDKGIHDLRFYKGNYYQFNGQIIQNPDFPLHHYFLNTNKFISHKKVTLEENKEYFRDYAVFNMDVHGDPWQYRVPVEFIHSSIYLFFETFVSFATHPTEKTWKSFFHKKPFLCVAGPNYYKFLKGLGFKLYEELFDYSFDGKDYQTRFTSVLNQVKKYLDYDVEKLNDLINGSEIQTKLDYNRKLANDISHRVRIWNLDDIDKCVSESSTDNLELTLRKNNFL